MKSQLGAILFLLLIGFGATDCNRAVQNVQSPGSVTHIVICWLKSPGDEAGRAKLIEASKDLAAIPGVVGVTAGEVLPSERPIVVSDYDVAIVFTFEDEMAMRDYLSNPAHQKATKEILAPLTKEVEVFDFINR